MAEKDFRKKTNDRTARGRPSQWNQRYGQKHRWQRVTDFPPGIAVPRRVRIYRRTEHYILQWWDPSAKKNLSDRVDGDLVAAIARARQIEEHLEHFRTAGLGAGNWPIRNWSNSSLPISTRGRRPEKSIRGRLSATPRL